MSGDYVYVGYKRCGCPTTVITDLGNKWTADEVADCIKRGERVERVTLSEYRERVFPEFIKDCPHGVSA